MTEPDEALLYAREQMADDLQQNGGSAEDVAAARAGAFDTLLKVAAASYRAGAAASSERIKELEEALKPFAEAAWSELRLRGLLSDYETFDGIGVRHWRKAWFAFNAVNTR